MCSKTIIRIPMNTFKDGELQHQIPTHSTNTTMSTLPRPTIIAVESDIDFKIACKPTIKRRQGQRRGIMKVRTLDESLRSCNSNSTVPPLTTISATNSSTVTVEQRHSSALSAPTLVEGGGPDEFLPSHVPSLAVTSDPTCRERDRGERNECPSSVVMTSRRTRKHVYLCIMY